MNPITITNYRFSFQELQVGDQFLKVGGGFNRIFSVHVITRLTPKYFVYGFGKLNETTGKHEYEECFRRDNGKHVGGYKFDSDAVLPTPEMVVEINQEIADRQTMNELREIKFDRLPIEQARKVLELIKSFPAED